MGLDMYLKAEKYVGGWQHAPAAERKAFERISKAVGAEADPRLPSLNVNLTVGYWRKANAIHAWFVENVQGGVDECREHPVSREHLKELEATCQKVLAAIETVPGKVHVGTKWENGVQTEVYEDGALIADPGIAERLLPTASGFFFGSTDYDENYLHDLKRTVAIVDRALAMPKEWTFSYQASW